MQLLGDKTKHLAHVLPVPLLADDALGALQIGGVLPLQSQHPLHENLLSEIIL
jgi:hypothetical protein